MLGDEKAMAVVGKLVAAQAAVFAKASLDPLARQAAREAAMEAVTGSYVSSPAHFCPSMFTDAIAVYSKDAVKLAMLPCTL